MATIRKEFFTIFIGAFCTAALGASAWAVTSVIDLKERAAATDVQFNGNRTDHDRIEKSLLRIEDKLDRVYGTVNRIVSPSGE